MNSMEVPVLPSYTRLNQIYSILRPIRFERYGILYEAEADNTQKDNFLYGKVWIWEKYDRKTQERDKNGLTVLDADEYTTNQTLLKLEAKIQVLEKIKSGVVPIKEYFRENNTLYYVMDIIQANTVRETAETLNPGQGSSIPERKLMTGILPLLEALQKLHSKNLIHGNINEDTVLIDKKGKLLLLGAGAASPETGKNEESIHLSEVFAGSEIYDSTQEQGPWTDIYALMAVLYYIVSGRKPQPTFERIVIESLISPRDAGAAISETANSIIMKGMALSVKDRYQDTESLISDIKKSFPDDTKIKKKRKKILVAVGILLAIVFTVSVGVVFHAKRREIFFHGEDTITFYLCPDSDTEPEDLERVHERIRVLAENERYLWEQEEGKVRVSIPRKLFGHNDIQTAVQKYLLDPWVISRFIAGDVKERDYFSLGSWYIGGQKTAASEDQIVRKPEGSVLSYKVTEFDESIQEEGLKWIRENVSIVNQTGINNDLIIELEIDPAKSNGFFVYSNKGGNFNCDVNDIGQYTLDYGYVLSADGRHMRLLANTETYALTNVVGLNVMAEPLSRSFHFIYKRDHIVWQDPKAVIILGKNQVPFSELQGAKQIAFFRGKESYSGEKLLKTELDEFGFCYAYGYSSDTDETCVACQSEQSMTALFGKEANSLSSLAVDAQGPSMVQWVDKNSEVICEEIKPIKGERE